MSEWTDHERLFGWMQSYRGVEVPCEACSGAGTRAYGSTATWAGGIGGQMITNDVCDTCWGTGDAHRKGADLRRLRAEIERLRASLAAARREALEEAAQVCDDYARHCDHTYPISFRCRHCGAGDCAPAIRALIDRTPASAEARERGEGEK